MCGFPVGSLKHARRCSDNSKLPLGVSACVYSCLMLRWGWGALYCLLLSLLCFKLCLRFKLYSIAYIIVLSGAQVAVCVEFCIFTPCLCVFLMGSLWFWLTSHKHAGKLISYAKTSVNMCVCMVACNMLVSSLWCILPRTQCCQDRL